MPTQKKKTSQFTPRATLEDSDIFTGLRIAGVTTPGERNSIWTWATMREALVGSEDDIPAGTPVFDELAKGYAPNAQVVSGNRLWYTATELLRASYPDGKIPTPSDAEDSPWREISRSLPAQLSQRIGPRALRALRDDFQLVPGKLYIILRAAEQGPVFVEAADYSLLAPDGYWLNPATQLLERAAYNLTTDTVSALATGGGGGSYTLTVTETIGGLTPGTYTDTDQGFITRMAVKYQAPGFGFFALAGEGSRTVRVGTSFPAGFKSVGWSTSNAQNVALNSISLQDVTAGTTLLTNEANDGTASASTAAFTAVAGESRRYRLIGTNSQGATFSADLVISGAYESYLGYSTSASLTGAQIVALGNAQLQNGRARTVGGVTATNGQYFYYGYEASAGDLTSIILDGAAPVLGAFTKLGDFATTNAAGAAVTIRLYRSNATNAFTNNSLAFS